MRTPARSSHGPGARSRRGSGAATVAAVALGLLGCGGGEPASRPPPTAEPGPAPEQETTMPFEESDYPWHTDIVATTFWVGEIFDPVAADGSQQRSAYDKDWMASYGGCDGVVVGGVCDTERRVADNGYFPRNMTPRENPFYLDLPFDDINNPAAFAMRGQVVPWADQPGYAGRAGDRTFSFMKNRWVRLVRGDRVCYGQVQDAGPAVYDDAEYVFGEDDARPANTRFNGSGLDVSPALNGCLGFSQLNGSIDRVAWQFLEFEDVPDGPWRTIVTTSGVNI